MSNYKEPNNHDIFRIKMQSDIPVGNYHRKEDSLTDGIKCQIISGLGYPCGVSLRHQPNPCPDYKIS